MKKIKFIILFTILSSTISLAQGTLGKGGKQLNAGLGFSDWGVPVYVGLDFGVHQDITIGPRLSFRNYSYTRSGNKYHQNLSVLSFNGNYHFNSLLNLPSAWDVYAGLTLGYYFWSDVKTSNGGLYEGNSSEVGLDLQIGGRYFVTDRFGINLELGGGHDAGGRFGITYKF
jgi:hypothetical protein